jgi:predicted Zn-dependent protease
MTQIEVKVVIDVQDQRQVEALNNLVAALAGGQAPQIIAQAPEKAVAPKQEKPKAEKPKADPKKETKQEEPAPQEETPEDDAPEIKIEEVRALLAKKVENNRSEIKTKLTALGAPNVTALAKDKYPEFVEFLNGLK